MAELVSVHVKAGSSKGPLVEADADGGLVVYVRQRAIEGAANDAVVRLVAAHFGVAQSRVSIRRGHTSKYKRSKGDLGRRLRVRRNDREGAVEWSVGPASVAAIGVWCNWQHG